MSHGNKVYHHPAEHRNVPVEEIETTETVQKTTTEQITICDSCGLNDDSEDIQLHTFSAQKLSEDLYFCEKCLDNTSINPISNKFSTFFSNREKEQTYIHAGFASQVFACQVVGFVMNGLTGALTATGIALIFGFLAIAAVSVWH